MKSEHLPLCADELSKEESQERINRMLLWLQGDDEQRPDRLHPATLLFAEQHDIKDDTDWQRLRKTIQALPADSSTVIMLEASGVHGPLLAELIEDFAQAETARATFVNMWHDNVQKNTSAQHPPRPDAESIQKAKVPLGELSDTHDEPDQAVNIETLFFKDARREPLLSAHEEVMLAKTIEAGVLAEEALAVPAQRQRIDASDQELQQLVQEGRAAKDRFIRANLRLVASIASRKMGRGLDKLDLIQEGTFGLMRAVEMYDHERGYKFSTYASRWIQQSIDRALADKGQSIRIPVHRHEDIRKLYRFEAQMVDSGHDIDDDILVGRLGWTVDKLAEVRRARQQMRVSSLNMPVTDNHGAVELGDLISDTSIIPNDDRLAHTELHQTLYGLLDTLTSREKQVLVMRMGLDGMGKMTLPAAGAKLGIGRERARQIEAKALAKLRHPSRSGSLRSLLRER